ncbi:MAG: hypothetical protein [crAssphage sp. isolate ctcc615]|uniref:Uncharacterized protein n=1 Tax=crAssphage sp. isolate ctcc615 TaxID=2989853 RepID=A0A345BNZ0_9CAUD|nr:MAG: hypothetical protein KNU00_gp72 [crAssphage sp. isolate ctcc615]AXF52161.1 MAG: hypothetical protein [crAssphage sp. isolate ctcc615]
MYVVIRRDRSEYLKEKVHELKKMACEIIECLEEAYSESHESEYGRERSRKDDRRHDDYDDYERDMARGRGGRGGYGGRGRY